MSKKEVIWAIHIRHTHIKRRDCNPHSNYGQSFIIIYSRKFAIYSPKTNWSATYPYNDTHTGHLREYLPPSRVYMMPDHRRMHALAIYLLAAAYIQDVFIGAEVENIGKPQCTRPTIYHNVPVIAFESDSYHAVGLIYTKKITLKAGPTKRLRLLCL